MSRTTLAVAGLTDFRKGLRGIDRDLPKGVRLLLNDVAQIVVDAAKPKVVSKTGAARGSLKAASTQTAAKISAGGTKAPYYPWLDFGGRVGKRKSVRREFIQGGRYIFPTVAEKRDEIEAAMGSAIVKLARANGIDVS